MAPHGDAAVNLSARSPRPARASPQDRGRGLPGARPKKEQDKLIERGLVKMVKQWRPPLTGQ